MKKVISLILSLLLVISCTCSAALSASAMDNSPSIRVATAQGRPGDTVEIPIEIQNNPGITSFRIIVEYDSAILKLTNIVFSYASQGFNTGTSQFYDSPYSISGFNAGVDINNNGQFAVLTFEVSQFAEEGRYDISMSYDEDDIFNMAGDNVLFALSNGYVEVGSCRHTGGEWEYLEEENCTNAGMMIKKCEICGKEYERKIVPAKGHTFSEWNIDKSATCTQSGERSRVCSVCTYEEREIIDVLGHNYGNGTVVTAPTCTKTGIKTYTCTECGETKTETIPKTAQHMYKTTVTKATTKKNGSIVTKCSVCGNVSKNTVIYYPKTITLSTTSYTYNGKVKKPSVTVKDSKGKNISSSNYTVSYSSGRKNVGQYTVTIKFKGNYSGTVKKTFTIKPKATTISKVTAGKKAFTIKWKKQSAATGYQIQYSTSSKLKNAKTINISKNKTTSKKVTKLKSKKKYYVRIRTYKTYAGKKVYSSWSKVKSVKTK